jgi:protein phosphatase 1L
MARERSWNDGTTSVVGIIDSGKIYVANAGDSRAIVVQRGGRVKPMSLDHRPERKDEESRIRKLGGTLKYWGRWRVEGVLAVSRLGCFASLLLHKLTS